MNNALNKFRFTVKPSISDGERALELARTVGVHPLTYQEYEISSLVIYGITF